MGVHDPQLIGRKRGLSPSNSVHSDGHPSKRTRNFDIPAEEESVVEHIAQPAVISPESQTPVPELPAEVQVNESKPKGKWNDRLS